MKDWHVFSAACMLTDANIRFEWGTKYLYLRPNEATRDKWDAYTEVCRAYEVPYQTPSNLLRFYVTIPYRIGNEYDGEPIFTNMPWGNDPAEQREGKDRSKRPNMSLGFRALQTQVELLREYYECKELIEHGGGRPPAHINRMFRLSIDPFVSKWK
jgi:hypothetical protein